MAQRLEPESGTLGYRLKAAARAAGKKPEVIAAEMKAMGTPTSAVSIRRWWKAGNPGGRSPRGPELAAYAEVVGCSVEELMGNGGTLPRAVMDALLVIARGLQAGQGIEQAAERALGKAPEEELLVTQEVEVMRRFFRDLGALTDQDLRALLADLHRRAREQGRRGGSVLQ